MQEEKSNKKHSLKSPGVQSTVSESPLFTQVSGFAFDKHNNLYACNFGTPDANIIKIDEDGNVTPLTKNFPGDRNFISMVYLDKFLYVTGFNNHVYKVDTRSGELTTFATLPNNGTNGLTFHDGAFYVVTCDGMNTGNIYKVNMDGTFSIFIKESDLEGTQYNGVVSDKDGNFYFTDEVKDAVAKHSWDGKLINSKFITGQHQAMIIHKHKIYLTDYTKNQISQYDMDGKLINEKFAEGGLTYAGGAMAFAENGDFYFTLEKDLSAGSGNVTLQKLSH